MVNSETLDEAANIIDDIGERPYAVISGNSVICEVEKALSPQLTPKNSVAFIFDVVLLIIFL